MMYKIIGIIVLAGMFLACTKEEKTEEQQTEQVKEFEYKVDRFADVQVLRYKVPGFDQLSLDQKRLVYFLSQAALSGRDIFYDQNYKHNLRFRKTIEVIVEHYSGDRESELFQRFMVWAKRFWFNNGIHHSNAFNKLNPGFTKDEFAKLIVDSQHPDFPTLPDEDGTLFIQRMSEILFDDNTNTMKKNQDGDDLVTSSAVNFYEGVKQSEVERFYKGFIPENPDRPESFGINSKVLKRNGEIVEEKWRVGGMYTEAIEEIIYWLQKAVAVAENETQARGLELLIEYYKTGDLKIWDEYNTIWVTDTLSEVDYINGFIEVYDDPLGMKGSFESVVAIKDFEMSKQMAALAQNAKYFEENSTIMEEHKKDTVKGVSFRVVNVVMESGGSAPTTPVGINLPNSNWIRKEYGSKSVSLGNIKDAYEQMGSSLEEFAYDEGQLNRGKEYGQLAGKMHTALHEVIGHGSGQNEKGVKSPAETLKNYASPLEETRADLVGLYFIMDQKMVDLGLIPNLDVAKAQYESYLRNGLMLQLRRLEPQADIQQSHMRNRQAISKWVYEKGKADNVVEMVKKESKTYVVINDYQKLRELFGQLLREIQRIKSQGDYEAGRDFIETYGIKVDQEIYAEVVSRYEQLDMAPFAGFVQPTLKPVFEGDVITDVQLSHDLSFVEQMLDYGKKYAFLPLEN